MIRLRRGDVPSIGGLSIWLCPDAMKRFADSLSVIDCNLLHSSRFRDVEDLLAQRVLPIIESSEAARSSRGTR